MGNDTRENQIAVTPCANDTLEPCDVNSRGLDTVLSQLEIRDAL